MGLRRTLLKLGLKIGCKIATKKIVRKVVKRIMKKVDKVIDSHVKSKTGRMILKRVCRMVVKNFVKRTVKKGLKKGVKFGMKGLNDARGKNKDSDKIKDKNSRAAGAHGADASLKKKLARHPEVRRRDGRERRDQRSHAKKTPSRQDSGYAGTHWSSRRNQRWADWEFIDDDDEEDDNTDWSRDRRSRSYTGSKYIETGKGRRHRYNRSSSHGSMEDVGEVTRK